MDKFQKWSEKFGNKFLPPLSKLAKQKDLVAIRDGFAILMPLMLAASFAILLNWVFLRPDSLFGAIFWPEGVKFFDQVLIPILSTISYAGLDMLCIFLSATVTYFLVRGYGREGIAPAIISLGCFLALTKMPYDATAAVEAAGYTITNPVMIDGVISTATTNSSNVFAALIIGLSVGHLYEWFLKKNFTIKMPDSVPPMVSEGFIAVIPGFAILLLWAFIGWFFLAMGTDFFTWILTTFQKPFMNFSQGLVFGMIYQLCNQLLWFFGLHGGNILQPVTNALYLTASIENVNAVANGMEATNILTYEFFVSYVWFGAFVVCFALIISNKQRKNKHFSMLAKLGLAPATFNIGEPILFGTPQVLNPYFAIPMVILGPITVFTAYVATAVGLIPCTYIMVPWVTPPVIAAFLSTGGSFAAAGMALFNIILSILVFLPFVNMLNKTYEMEE